MKVLFTRTGWEHYQHWAQFDSTMLLRVNTLIEQIRRQPFTGIGKPEPLRDDLAGWWSRRITSEHRLVYRVAGKGDGQYVEISACRLHYR